MKFKDIMKHPKRTFMRDVTYEHQFATDENGVKSKLRLDRHKVVKYDLGTANPNDELGHARYLATQMAVSKLGSTAVVQADPLDVAQMAIDINSQIKSSEK